MWYELFIPAQEDYFSSFFAALLSSPGKTNSQNVVFEKLVKTFNF